MSPDPKDPAPEYVEVIAHPGEVYRLAFQTDPLTGERRRGHRRQSHSLLFRATLAGGVPVPPGKGRLVPFTPRQLGSAVPSPEPEFRVLAKTEGLVLVNRAERRAMWKAERKRYKAIVKARKNAP